MAFIRSIKYLNKYKASVIGLIVCLITFFFTHTFPAYAQTPAPVKSIPKTYYCTLHPTTYHQPGVCPVCKRGLITHRQGAAKKFARFWVKFTMHPVIGKVYFALIVPAILQGFILGLLLWFYNPSPKVSWQRVRQWLAILIGTFALHEAAYYFIQLRIIRYPLWAYFLAHSSLLGLGVALYFFVRQVTSPDFTFKKAHFWHFLPAVSILGGYYLLDWLGLKLPTYPYSNNVLWWLQFLSALHAVFYAVRSRQLLLKMTTQKLQWLRWLILGVVLVWSIRLFFSLIDAFLFDYWIPNQAYYLPWILLMFLIYAIALFGFFRPVAWQINLESEPIKQKTPSQASVVEQDWSALVEALIKLMEEEQLYLKPKLSLNQIAEQLGENPANISKALGQGLQTNFYDFINQYRVAHVKQLLLNPDYSHFTILGIAYESGFHAKSTFNLVFKKITGLSPSEYKKQVRAQNAANSPQNKSN